MLEPRVDSGDWPIRLDVNIRTQLAERLVGQPGAIDAIVPFAQMHAAGLSPEGRPAGVFLLLGPSGTGKTRTVEALADVLHGSPKQMLRIDCGEFQEDHEIAKLLGAPPGYVGHRESHPILTQQKLDEVTSHGSKLSLVLFDEVEKAAPSLAVLLLGVLDKATLRLGDGAVLNFEHTLIFLTSNLGAREMVREMQPDIGFRSSEQPDAASVVRRLESIGLAAVRKRFSPEFVNRLDAVVTYSPLDETSRAAILDQHLTDLQRHLDTRLEHRSFDVMATAAARDFLLAKGVSAEYGARELKRTIHRHVAQPLAVLVMNGDIPPGAEVIVDLDAAGTGLSITVGRIGKPRTVPAPTTVLVVDDNEDLVGWLEGYLGEAGCRVLRAGSVREAAAFVAEYQIDAAFIDQILPDGDGVELAAQLNSRTPNVFSVVMTGGDLSEDALALCRRFAMPVLTKPFPGPEMLTLIDTRDRGTSARTQSAG